VPNFAGRTAEFTMLTEAIDDGGAAASGARIITITGVAGVGKTTLAVHWAQQVARHFPDGQLYVNLRGFDPLGAPVAAGDAIRGFLAALSVPAEMTPATIDAQAGLYRSVLAGKRMLVVLDNARDPAQVRPLLPGSAGCMVIVTSRTWLAGLVAAEGASQLTLDVLSQEEAAELLTERIGRHRVRAEPDAIAELIGLCAGLPVALVIVAARAIEQPHLPLRMLAAELRGARSRLDALTTGDSATDVRSVFSWSYLSLSAPAARLFRLAGLHPGPSLSTEAAASLAGLPLPATSHGLRELVGARLLDEQVPGRFVLHDLLREYAAERARSTGSQASRRAAIHRMLDHYLHTAHAAESIFEPQHSWYSLGKPARGVTIGYLADCFQARQWFDQEHLALMSALSLAADLGFELHACLLPATLTGVLDQSGRWEDLATSSTIAIEAAQRSGHPDAGVYALRGLAAASIRQGRLDEGYEHLRLCLDQFTELKNLDGQGRAHENLACLMHFMGDDEAAIEHARRGLELFEMLGEQRAGLAAALNTAGWFEAQRGNTAAGLEDCERALAIAQEIDNHKIAAATWDSLGYVRHLLGQHETAVRCYEQAAAIYADLGAIWYRAEVLTNLGEAHEANGDHQAARDLRREALEVFELTQHPQAATLRARVQDRGVTTQPRKPRTG
jgi:tetratricopeptide (TPR) repeat protein